MYTTIVITGIETDDEDSVNELELINEYLTKVYERKLGELQPPVSTFFGRMYGESINHFKERDFLEFCSKIEWRIPENTQIFLSNENDSVYRIITIDNLKDNVRKY